MVAGVPRSAVGVFVAAMWMVPALSHAQVGACCRPDGVCTVVERAACRYAFLGEGTTCVPNPCAGACCFSDGRCDLTFRVSCGWDGGTFMGEGVDCGAVTCMGACCLAGGTCEIRTQADCVATAGGIFLGYETPCITANCPGACCGRYGSCWETSAANCTQVGDVFLGVGTRCATSVCLGACCLPDGSCEQLTASECDRRWGFFRGSGVACGDTECPPSTPAGACCYEESCQLMSRPYCERRGQYQGDGTTCEATTCTPGGCCLPNDLCISMTEFECAAQAGVFLGVGVECPLWYCNDACDGVLLGDTNGDGGVNNFDIDAFVLAVSNPERYIAELCGGSAAVYLCRTDMDGSGAVNNFDFDPFVWCITRTPPPGEPCP